MRISRVSLAWALTWLLLPYLLLIRHLPNWSWPELSELWWATENSIEQALGSALIALIAAIPLVGGLLRLGDHWRRTSEWLLLSPSLFPPLFLLLSFLSWVNPFPVGLLGVILVQGFMNAGLVAVMLERSLRGRWGALAEMAEVAGAGRWLLFRRSWRLVAGDLAGLFLFLFAICFASFSIPLVIGGGRATNLEILIFEKIRISGQWGEALVLSLWQLGVLALLGWATRLSREADAVTSNLNLRRWGHAIGVVGIMVYGLIFWLPLVGDARDAFVAVIEMPGLLDDVRELAVPSLGLAIGTGFLCLVLFVTTAIGAPENGVPRLLRGWLAPSSALVGFAFLFSGSENEWLSLAFALAILFAPFLFRLGFDRRLEALGGQIEIARTLGAGDLWVWWRVVLPQIIEPACWLAGLASLWTIGEYALGRIILAGPRTWSLLAESLLSSYRVDAGLGIGFLILGAGLIVFLFFVGVGRVLRRTLAS